MAQDQWTLRREKEAVNGEPAHGPPLQARVVAANRTVLTTCHDDPGAHGHEQGGKANAKLNRARTLRAVGMAWQRRAGKQTQPAERGRCRQTQPADDLTGTALEETAGRRRRPASRRAGRWRACGGAGHSGGGLRPTYLSPSHLSPLPVSINTHSLNLRNQI